MMLSQTQMTNSKSIISFIGAISISLMANNLAHATVYSVSCEIRGFESDQTDLFPSVEMSPLASYYVKEGSTFLDVRARSLRDLNNQINSITFVDKKDRLIGELRLRIVSEAMVSLVVNFKTRENDEWSATSPLVNGRWMKSSGDTRSVNDRFYYTLKCAREDFPKALSRSPDRGRRFSSMGDGEAKRTFESLPKESELIVEADASLPDTVAGSNAAVYYRESDEHWCSKTIEPGTPDGGEDVDLHTYRCVQKLCE